MRLPLCQRQSLDAISQGDNVAFVIVIIIIIVLVMRCVGSESKLLPTSLILRYLRGTYLEILQHPISKQRSLSTRSRTPQPQLPPYCNDQGRRGKDISPSRAHAHPPHA